MTNPSPRVEWDVGVVWLSRHLHRPLQMLRRRVRAARGDSRPSRSSGAQLETGEPSRLALLDGCASVDEIALIAVVVIVFLLAGPFLLAAVIGLLEVLLILTGAVLVAVLRIALGRPWEVLARSETRCVAWQVVGYMNARSLVAEVEDAWRLGHDPAEVRVHLLDPDPPTAVEEIPSLYHAAEFRLLGRAFGAMLGATAAIGLLLLYFRLG